MPVVHVICWDEGLEHAIDPVSAVLDAPGWQELARYECLKHYSELHDVTPGEGKAWWNNADQLQCSLSLTRAGAGPLEFYEVIDVELVTWSPGDYAPRLTKDKG